METREEGDNLDNEGGEEEDCFLILLSVFVCLSFVLFSLCSCCPPPCCSCRVTSTVISSLLKCFNAMIEAQNTASITFPCKSMMWQSTCSIHTRVPPMTQRDSKSMDLDSIRDFSRNLPIK